MNGSTFSLSKISSDILMLNFILVSLFISKMSLYLFITAHSITPEVRNENYTYYKLFVLWQ